MSEYITSENLRTKLRSLEEERDAALARAERAEVGASIAVDMSRVLTAVGVPAEMQAEDGGPPYWLTHTNRIRRLAGERDAALARAERAVLAAVAAWKEVDQLKSALKDALDREERAKTEIQQLHELRVLSGSSHE